MLVDLPVLVLILGAALLAAVLVAALIHRQMRLARQLNRELAARLLIPDHASARVTALETLCRAAYNALILVDGERSIIHMNEAAVDLFQTGMTVAFDEQPTLIAVTRSHELDAAVTGTLQAAEGLDLQIMIRANTYRVRTAYTDVNGAIYVAVALEDVSELQRLGRARRDMVANISHELRTPITSIRLLVDTLQRSESLKEERTRRLLEKIAAETDSLQQMAQELLDLAMIESGRAEFIMTPVPLGEIISSAVGHFSEQARRKNLTIEAQVPPHLVVLADRQQVERVLGNLLHNAIKFSPPDGIIQVSVEPQADWVQVAVTDSGPGIDSEEQERVFERFYRADSARQGGGTGLGLAIAKHIVQAHGGRIWVEEAPALPGACLCFTLPTSDEPPVPALPDDPGQPPLP